MRGSHSFHKDWGCYIKTEFCAGFMNRDTSMHKLHWVGIYLVTLPIVNCENKTHKLTSLKMIAFFIWELLGWFSNGCQKTNTTDNRSNQRDQPIRIPTEITGNWLIAREKSRAQDVIGFVFASHWLRVLLTKRSYRSRIIQVRYFQQYMNSITTNAKQHNKNKPDQKSHKTSWGQEWPKWFLGLCRVSS